MIPIRKAFATAAISILAIFFLMGRRAAGQVGGQSAPAAPTLQPSTIRVDASPRHELNSFDPDRALGSSIDVLSHDVIDKIYTPGA